MGESATVPHIWPLIGLVPLLQTIAFDTKGFSGGPLSVARLRQCIEWMSRLDNSLPTFTIPEPQSAASLADSRFAYDGKAAFLLCPSFSSALDLLVGPSPAPKMTAPGLICRIGRLECST
jgi:hypothetical protein